MGALQKTLFIIALLVLLTQTVRHLYVRWVEPTSSALDKYELPVKEEIKKANSLDELLKQYDEARKKTPEAENRAVDPLTISGRPSETDVLKTAIQEWEARTKEIFELRFFWGCGLVLLLLGLLCYRQQCLWLGLTLITTGIAEMVWWTSPSFRWGGASREFDKLLTNKIAFSLMSIILLLITGHIVERLNALRVKL
jgi:hypothetical protein